MTTRSAILFALFFGPTVAFSLVHAQTYQWKDSSGQTVISDVPPPPNVKGRRALGANQPSVVSEKPAEGAKTADAPKTVAEKDMEFKKRQQEAKEKADKQAKEQAAEADRRQNCERARGTVAALEANQPVSTYDDQGQRKLMDSAQREQELERARRFMAESCK